MIRLVLIFLGITFVCLLGAFFATPDFTMPCSNDLLTCLENAYSLPILDRLWAGAKCVCSNVLCVFNQFKGIL